MQPAPTGRLPRWETELGVCTPRDSSQSRPGQRGREPGRGTRTWTACHHRLAATPSSERRSSAAQHSTSVGPGPPMRVLFIACRLNLKSSYHPELRLKTRVTETLKRRCIETPGVGREAGGGGFPGSPIVSARGKDRFCRTDEPNAMFCTTLRDKDRQDMTRRYS